MTTSEASATMTNAKATWRVGSDGKARLEVVIVGDDGGTGGIYLSPNGKNIQTGTSLDSLFSDDFGGNAIDLNRWDVIPGGLPAVTSGAPYAALQGSPVPAFSQNAIGSGVSTGIVGPTIAASQLTVGMGTTANAEVLLLSRQTFAGKEDILAIFSKSQPLAANSFFIGLVEVDPATGIPLLNPNFAGEFTNRGGLEAGLTVTTTAFQAEAIGDSSGAKAVSAVGVAGAALTTAQEYLIEIDSRDIIVSNALVDNVAAKAAGSVRVSSQCPNDQKLYKLAIRCRNSGGAPATNTNLVLSRILVIDNFEQRVQISSGEGDSIGAKAVAVNVTNSPTVTVAVSSNQIGVVPLAPSATVGGNVSVSKGTAAATTNATLVKATPGTIGGGILRNNSAAVKYFKFFNKATAPVVGTDTPLHTIGIAAGATVSLVDVFGAAGFRFATGIGFAITGAFADLDATVLTAGDVEWNFVYV